MLVVVASIPFVAAMGNNRPHECSNKATSYAQTTTIGKAATHSAKTTNAIPEKRGCKPDKHIPADYRPISINITGYSIQTLYTMLRPSIQSGPTLCTCHPSFVFTCSLAVLCFHHPTITHSLGLTHFQNCHHFFPSLTCLLGPPLRPLTRQ